MVSVSTFAVTFPYVPYSPITLHCSLTSAVITEHFGYLDAQLAELSAQCVEKLRAQGFSLAQITTEPYLHLRYAGTDCALMCGPSSTPSGPSPTHGDFNKTFLERHSYLLILTIFWMSLKDSCKKYIKLLQFIINC